MLSIKNREGLPPAVVEELDQLVSTLKAFLLREHNEDGTHNFGALGISGQASTINNTITQLIDQSQAGGQWWKQGPWLLDDPDASQENAVALRPPKTAAGTYDNWAPTGIDSSVVVEIEPDGGNVTLTGLKMMDGARNKRLLLFRNRDSANSVTLKHLNAGSLTAYQFDLPNSVDVVLDPNQNIWLYYDPNRGQWTVAITAQKAGGITEGVSSSGVVGGGFWDSTITKVNSDTVTNSATLASDSELTFSVTAGLYTVEFLVWHEATSFSNFKWTWIFPILSDANLFQGSFTSYGTGGSVSQNTAPAGSTTSWPTGTGGRIDGQPILNKKVPIFGRFSMNVTNAGTVVFKFAQGTAGVGNSVIVRPGSYVAYKKLA